MGYSTVDLFATNEELIELAREFAEKNDLWVTIIRFPSLVVCGRAWASVESRTRHRLAPDERMEIVLTATEPDLSDVGQVSQLLEKNRFPEWVVFQVACADENLVLTSRVMTWLSEDSHCTKEVRSLLQNIRRSTMTGYWVFTADMSVRGFYTNLKRYTAAAKALQDRGAKVSSFRDDPPYILGKECPYPLSEATVVDRKRGSARDASG